MILAILFFIAYSCVVFFIDNYIVLICFSIFNLILCFILRTGLKQTIKNILRILIFASIVFLFNLIFDSVIQCLITAWKILIVANFTFIFSKGFSPYQISLGISQLLYPLKIFKIDIDYISLTIVIALQFIPILTKSAKNIQKALISRGFKINIKNILCNGHLIFFIFFSEVFKRVDAIEIALMARGFENRK